MTPKTARSNSLQNYFEFLLFPELLWKVEKKKKKIDFIDTEYAKNYWENMKRKVEKDNYTINYSNRNKALNDIKNLIKFYKNPKNNSFDMFVIQRKNFFRKYRIYQRIQIFLPDSMLSDDSDEDEN